MTNAWLRMIEDLHLRNSAKALVEADIAHLRADLAERGPIFEALFGEDADERDDEDHDYDDRHDRDHYDDDAEQGGRWHR